jgi:hypothetical protein
MRYVALRHPTVALKYDGTKRDNDNGKSRDNSTSLLFPLSPKCSSVNKILNARPIT